MHRAAKFERTSQISGRNGPCPVCENLRLSLPSPAKTRPGEVGGINCGGDMGVRRCLARSFTSLALLRTPKSANGPRSNSFRPDSPSTTNLPRGRKTQTAPLTTPDMVRSGRVLQPQLNLQLVLRVPNPADILAVDIRLFNCYINN